MAANTDKFKKLSRKWTGQIGSGGVANASVTTIPLSSTTNLPTDTAVVVTIDRVDVNGKATPTLEESVIGVVSGSNLTDCVRGAEGTAQAHSAGAVVEVLVNAKTWNDMIDGYVAEHSQLGVHDTTKVAMLAGTQTFTGVKTFTSPLFQGNLDAWNLANETWTYASATTITVPSGAASKYQKGDKIKLTQTTVKYFYIIAVADTVLTITGGDDYTLADAAISANYYSKVENPQGFPCLFNWTPAFSGGGSAGTYAIQYNNAKFSISGSKVFLSGSARIANKGSWTGDVVVSIPVAGISLDAGYNNFTGSFLTTFNSASVRGYLSLSSNAASGKFSGLFDASTLDWSSVANNDRLIFIGSYMF